MRSLRTWLALGLTAAIVVPAAVGIGAWLLTSAWQTGRQQARIEAATRQLASARLDTPEGQEALLRHLTGLGVEAQLAPDLKEAGKAAVTDGQVRELKRGADLVT